MTKEFDLKATLIRMGVPGGDAALITELSAHAASEAAETLCRVSDSAPPEFRALVLLFASRHMQDSLEKFILDSTSGTNEIMLIMALVQATKAKEL